MRLKGIVALYVKLLQEENHLLVLFYNTLDMSAYSAYVVWTDVKPNWNYNKLI